MVEKDFTSAKSVERAILNFSKTHLPQVQWRALDQPKKQRTVDLGRTANVSIFTGSYIFLVGIALLIFPKAAFGTNLSPIWEFSKLMTIKLIFRASF